MKKELVSSSQYIDVEWSAQTKSRPDQNHLTHQKKVDGKRAIRHSWRRAYLNVSYLERDLEEAV